MVAEEKSDGPTLSEILASIRRITAEERSLDLPSFSLDGAGASQRQNTHGSDDPEDFELPSMFRQGRLTETPPPFGLPSDFIGSGEPGSSRIPHAPSIHSGTPGSSSDIGASYAQPGHAHSSYVPREMPTCRDQVLSRMGQPSSVKSMASTPTLAYESSVVPKAKLRVNYLIGAGSRLVDQQSQEAAATPASMPPVLPGSEKPVSEGIASSKEYSSKPDDGTDFLRPLLRKWLDDNVSRVLAQALIEIIKEDDRKS